MNEGAPTLSKSAAAFGSDGGLGGCFAGVAACRGTSAGSQDALGSDCDAAGFAAGFSVLRWTTCTPSRLCALTSRVVRITAAEQARIKVVRTTALESCRTKAER